MGDGHQAAQTIFPHAHVLGASRLIRVTFYTNNCKDFPADLLANRSPEVLDGIRWCEFWSQCLQQSVCLCLQHTPVLLRCVLVSPLLITQAAFYTVRIMNTDKKCPQQGPEYDLKHVSKTIKNCLIFKIPTHLIFHKIKLLAWLRGGLSWACKGQKWLRCVASHCEIRWLILLVQLKMQTCISKHI